ncbi:hypothetical protein [Thermus thermophilus]|uniref:hypothetical protein n=1 Tax=Thermus thermophilus TaxID=274 RepID=UPI001FCD3BE0|nr:hypothetical protein [Thermus thermophilus]BDG22795.1 hypothetical protein TthSNM17_24570 [Thermus thermophilus]
MIRRLAGVLWALAQTLPDPDEDPDLGPFCTYLRQRYGRHPLALSPKEWEEGLLDLIAEAIAEGWDRYGAPSAARDPEGEGYIASAEVGPETQNLHLCTLGIVMLGGPLERGRRFPV